MRAHSSQRGWLKRWDTSFEPRYVLAFLFYLFTTDIWYIDHQANAGQWRPTKANEDQCRPTKANEGQRKPTTAMQANDSQRQPTKANDSRQNPMQAHLAPTPNPHTRKRVYEQLYVRFFLWYCVWILFYSEDQHSLITHGHSFSDYRKPASYTHLLVFCPFLQSISPLLINIVILFVICCHYWNIIKPKWAKKMNNWRTWITLVHNRAQTLDN